MYNLTKMHTHKRQGKMKGKYSLATVCVNQSITSFSGKHKFAVANGDNGSISNRANVQTRKWKVTSCLLQ